LFSLVMATYNRAPILCRCLESILAQDGIADCELLIIDDGSTDETRHVLAQFAANWPAVIRIFHQANQGPARARNLGVEQARHQRILFIDDDVFPRRDMLLRHKALLDRGFTGSQGLLVWHPEIARTPILAYLDGRGTQFDFDRVPDPERLTFRHVYSGNLAIEREAVLRAGGFDGSFSFSAFEDTALAYRMLRNGARIALNRDAVADHLHDMTEQQYLRREYKVGAAAGVLVERYPEIAEAIRIGRLGLVQRFQLPILRFLLQRTPLLSLLNYHWRMRLLTREAFRSGLLEYQHKAARTPQRA
jgi:glycosyltransferase involved in cell wall biosynthesis